MSWEDRYPPPAENQPRRMKPNVFARTARFACRHPLIIIGLWIALGHTGRRLRHHDHEGATAGHLLVAADPAARR